MSALAASPSRGVLDDLDDRLCLLLRVPVAVEKTDCACGVECHLDHHSSARRRPLRELRAYATF